nr:four-carbon acid sugar kinase family protein [uncultured Lichenicoccus sp.]
MVAPPLLSYYGDDLTGSTDAMEALSLGGVETVLFLRPPDATQLARFQACRAIGLAGTSRSRSPDWMERELRPALSWLRWLDAAVCHYKVCSTFDSSPRTGSIGRAIDIGHQLFGQKVTPLVVGVPQLRRYTAFGTLFATMGGVTYRIDSHPVMSRHPVTPMHEADLCLHLAQQTAKPVQLADLTLLKSPSPEAALGRLMDEAGTVLLLDVLDAQTQQIVGETIWRHASQRPLFVAGSSGVEYALLKAWQAAGLASPAAKFPSPGALDRIAVVSGSCSQVTEGQIAWSLQHGFAGIALDPTLLAAPGDITAGDPPFLRQALALLAEGRSPILYSAMGPQTDLGSNRLDEDGRHQIGRNLGRILRRLVAEAGLTRAVVAGGDTSSHALGELGVLALKTLLPLPETPGSPLCVAYHEAGRFDGLQIALKGGQIGSPAYFSNIRNGSGAA